MIYNDGEKNLFESEKEYNKELKGVTQELQSEIRALQASYDIMMDRTLDEDKKLEFNVSYPQSDVWEFKTTIERIDFDAERNRDVSSGRGFIISPSQAIQKELKAMDGIFSPRYGQSLSDVNPFIDRYRCKCGALRGRIYNGIKCTVPGCNTVVKYVDDDFGCFGWMVLNKYHIIHPNLYKSLEALISPTKLNNILIFIDNVDEDGHSIDKEEAAKIIINTSTKKDKSGGVALKERGKNEPFYGNGMRWFKDNIKEVLDYYMSVATNKASKKPYYDDLIKNLDILFIQSIPVYTTHLRPYDASDKGRFAFEGTNAIYNMMSKSVTDINRDALHKDRHIKNKEQLLHKLQVKLNELYKEIDNILSGKKGNVRLLAGGRFNFSSRDVITQNPKLKIDQVTLPYWCLVDILQQQIVNVLTKTYNMSNNDAYDKWYLANIEPDDIIIQIIEGLMFTNPEGLPIVINRNPSIKRGSLLQMFCVGMTFTYTMALPLQILPLLAADFDGDVLNVFYILSQEFFQRANKVINPKNSMYISNNDGKLNGDVIPSRDTLINSNTLVNLSRSGYTEEELRLINECKNAIKDIRNPE